MGGGLKKISFRFTPISYVMVQYKTFGLKHFIVFVKKMPPTGHITFWPTPLKIEISKLFFHRHGGIYPVVLRAHAQKSPFFLSCFKHFWRKVSKTTSKRHLLWFL